MTPGENYFALLEKIKQKRPNDPPTLIAVSKKHPRETILEAIRSGIRVFGENQIKEGLEKFSSLQNNSFELHHIGPLQTGTLKKLFPFFSFTHGAGSENSLRELTKVAMNKKNLIRFFLQVNLTEEDSKSGFDKKSLLNFLPRISEFENEFCKFHGLMTMGPTDESPIKTREVFRELNQIKINYCPNAKLSMGMSGDWEIACEEGSDYLRIGTAIFGQRIT